MLTPEEFVTSFASKYRLERAYTDRQHTEAEASPLLDHRPIEEVATLPLGWDPFDHILWSELEPG